MGKKNKPTGTKSSATKTQTKPSKKAKPPPSKPSSTTTSSASYLKYNDGAILFRQRLTISILSNRPLLLRNIRSSDPYEPGLRDYEASYLRLLDSLTDGTRIEINATGTQLRFVPGMLLGSPPSVGKILHECPHSRSVGWFLEGIMPLAPFGKDALSVTLRGVTEGTVDMDPSADYLAATFIPILTKVFGVGNEEAGNDGPPPSLRIHRRGAAPGGEGEVHLFCPIVKQFTQPIHYTDMGKIKRIRGTAVSCRISPSGPSRVAYGAKGLLFRLLPDVWIHTDVHSANRKSTTTSTDAKDPRGPSNSGGGGCGPSPSLSIHLIAESTTSTLLCAEACQNPENPRGKELPEDLGIRAASLLLEQVRRGGCIDTDAQSFVLILMCLGPEDVSRVRVGTLSRYAVGTLRLLKEGLGVEFKVTPEEEDGGRRTVVLSCLGTGYRNMARVST